MSKTLNPLSRLHPYLSSMLLLLAVLLLPRDAFATQINQNQYCPATSELAAELTARKDKLVKLELGLNMFMSGKRVADIPLTALFMIDLNDADAVDQRVAQLKGESSDKNATDIFISCALSMDSFRSTATEITKLQQDIIRLRLQFLTLPSEKREAILHPQMEATAQANSVNQLQEEHRSALEEQKQAVKALARAEEHVLTGENGSAGDLIAGRAELERTRSDITALQVKWLSDLEQQATFYQETSEKLAEIGRFLLQSGSATELSEAYQKSVSIWRELVDKTYKVVTDRDNWVLPDLPDYPQKLLNGIGDTSEARQYAETYAEVKAFRETLQDKIGTRLQDSVDLHYRVLLQSGEIRSQLLNQLLDHGDYSPLTISTDLFQDIRREFNIVPYRWTATFYLRTQDFRRRLNQGWEGLADTALSVALLIAFFVIPWVIWLLTQRLARQLNQLRISLVRQSRTNPWASKLAQIIQKILPYSSWLAMLLAVYIAQKLLVMTVFSELTLLLPYARYYIFYRLFRQLLQCDFIWVNRQIRAAKLWDLRRQVDVASRTLGLLAFLIFSFINAIESLIRRGIIYHFTTMAMLDLGILIAMGFSYQWRGVIAAGLTKLIPGRLGDHLAKVCNSRWGLVVSIPALLALALLLLMRQLGNWGSHFELTKRISAEVFRYQLESAIDKTSTPVFVPPPQEYRKHFALAGALRPEKLMKPSIPALNEIRRLLESWDNGTSTVHTIAIVGHKGTGKTCMLDYLKQYSPTTPVIRITVTEKLTSRIQVMEFFSQALNIPLTNNLDISMYIDADRPKTIVLIDDAHNFFLSSLGGFEGFDNMLALINRPIRNLFWCLDFNHHAWSYLNGVYAHHQYFGAVVRLTPWSEQAIQELILERHTQTTFRLSYDEILEAAGSQNNTEQITYIENRFFSLLRQQSRGNPRLAVHLWLSSLRLVGNNALQVGLPEEPEMTIFSDLSEDALFVFAGIARHENLTLSQAMAVTQLSEEVVRLVLEWGVRFRLLDCEENGVYRLGVLYQYPLINYLQAKHCLYE